MFTCTRGALLVIEALNESVLHGLADTKDVFCKAEIEVALDEIQTIAADTSSAAM